MKAARQTRRVARPEAGTWHAYSLYVFWTWFLLAHTSGWEHVTSEMHGSLLPHVMGL